jgi:Flp pilus assembly protein TadD
MSTNRLEVLKSLVARNPADAFARYGLAMELARSGKPEEAVEEFRQLLTANPNYAAAYFHGGQTLEKLGRVEEARALYEQGIALTARTGDGHARSELQAALDLLPI